MPGIGYLEERTVQHPSIRREECPFITEMATDRAEHHFFFLNDSEQLT